MARQGRAPNGSGVAERRLTAEHVVTRALAEASTFADAVRKILEAICTALDREHACPEFHAISTTSTFGCGIGLPRRVWTTAEPAWIRDVVLDTNFPRARVAAREGLHAAFGFPILLRGEVLGVMEFFSEIRATDIVAGASHPARAGARATPA